MLIKCSALYKLWGQRWHSGYRAVLRLGWSQLMPLEFFIDIKSFRSHSDHGDDSASNRNEYQEHFLGGKGGRCGRLTTLPPSCAVVMKRGNLNITPQLQALPLPLLYNSICSSSNCLFQELQRCHFFWSNVWEYCWLCSCLFVDHSFWNVDSLRDHSSWDISSLFYGKDKYPWIYVQLAVTTLCLCVICICVVRHQLG